MRARRGAGEYAAEHEPDGHGREPEHERRRAGEEDQQEDEERDRERERQPLEPGAALEEVDEPLGQAVGAQLLGGGLQDVEAVRGLPRRGGADLALVHAQHEVGGGAARVELQAAHELAARPQVLAHRGGEDGAGGPAHGHSVAHRHPAPGRAGVVLGDVRCVEDARVDRGGQHQQLRRAALGDELEAPVVPRERRGLGELPERDPLVGLQHVADLLPGGLHVGLLVVLHDPRAETGGHPPARVEVELVDPVVVRGKRIPVAVHEQALLERVPPAVQRGGDERVGVLPDVVLDLGIVRGHLLRDAGRRVRRGGRRGGVAVGEVDERREVGLERMRVGLRVVERGPLPVLDDLGELLRRVEDVGDPQRTAQLQDALEPLLGRRGGRVDDPAQVGAGLLHVHVADADAAVDRLGLQQADEVLEVADGSGAEVPAVVVRELRREHRVRPGDRVVRRGARGVEAEAGEPAALERRHEKRVVRRVRAQAARADDARVPHVGVGGERAVELALDRVRVVGDERAPDQAPVHVHVRPRPELARTAGASRPASGGCRGAGAPSRSGRRRTPRPPARRA